MCLLSKLNKQLSRKGLWSTVLFFVLTLLVVFVNPTVAEATPYRVGSPLKGHSKVRVGNQAIDSDYVFIPELTPNSRLEFTSPSDLPVKDVEYYNFHNPVKFSTKGVMMGGSNWNTFKSHVANRRIYARYTNVGYVDGNSVDLIITITNAEPYGTPSSIAGNVNGTYHAAVGLFAFRGDDIGFTTQGLKYADVEYKTVRSGTNTPVKTSGYYTFDDVDYYQYVGFNNHTFNNQITGIQVENNANRLNIHSSNDGYQNIGYTGKYDVQDNGWDARHAFTILYKDTATLNFRWGHYDWIKSKDLSYVRPYVRQFRHNNALGDLLKYTPRKGARTKPKKPEKTQSVRTADNQVRHGARIRYNIRQEVPSEHELYWYNKFELADTLDSIYDINTAHVYSNKNGGENVSSQFNISIDHKSNTVRATAKNPKSRNLYGLTYRLQIEATLNGNKVVQKMGNNNSYNIDNKGWSTFNGSWEWTNSVRYNMPKRIINVRHQDRFGNLILAEKVTKIDGMPYDIQPKTNLSNAKGHKYVHFKTQGNPKGTISGDVSVVFTYDEPRPIKIAHRVQPKAGDPESNKLLGTDTVWEYSAGADEDLDEEEGGGVKTVTIRANWFHYTDHEDYYYRPRQPDSISFEIPLDMELDAELTHTFYYDVPRTITTHHYDKDDMNHLRTTYIKGIYDGDTWTVHPLVNTLRDRDNYFYRPVDPSVRTGVVHFDHSFDILYERPRIIELIHYDDDNLNRIRTDIYGARIYDTDAYKIYSYRDEELQYYHQPNSQKYFYYPLLRDGVPNQTHAGDVVYEESTVIEKDVDLDRNTFTLEFYYTKPAVDIGLNYIRIDTDRNINGLPSTVDFDNHIIVKERWKDNNVTFKFAVYDRDNKKLVYEKDSLKPSDIASDIFVSNPGNRFESKMTYLALAKHLNWGDEARYEAVITTNNKKTLVTGYATSPTMDTQAHAASERVLKGDSVKGQRKTFKFEDVARTDRHLGHEFKEYYERVTATLDPDVSLISGYGYELVQDITFETEIDDLPLPDIRGIVSAHKNISDGDYPEDYKYDTHFTDEVADAISTEGRHVFDLVHNHSDSDDKKSRETKLIMPSVYVNHKDGHVSLKNNANRIDGGHKVYIPIWVNQLGAYKYNVHTSRMGQNHIKFDLNQNVKIDAYMFGHIDSDTLNDDALVIEPAKKTMLDKWFGDR